MSEKLSKFLNNLWADFERKIEAIIVQHEAKGCHKKAEARKRLAEKYRGYYQLLQQLIEAQAEPSEKWIEEKAKILVGKMHYVPDLKRYAGGKEYEVQVELAKDFIRNLLKEVPMRKPKVEKVSIAEVCKKLGIGERQAILLLRGLRVAVEP